MLAVPAAVDAAWPQSKERAGAGVKAGALDEFSKGENVPTLRPMLERVNATARSSSHVRHTQKRSSDICNYVQPRAWRSR